MKLTKNKIFLILLALAIVAALVVAFQPDPIQVDTAPATRGPLQVTVDEDGRTRIQELYVVSAPLAGRLLRIELEPGDPVTAGKTLVASLNPGDPSLLDPRARAQAQAIASAAQAAFERAKIDLTRTADAREVADRELERKTVVWDKGFLTESEYDAVELAAKTAAQDSQAAQSALQIARFELEQAEAALLHTRGGSENSPAEWRFDIQSPIDGRVLRIFEESSTVVTAGTPLVELGDPTDLEVVIDVLSRDAVRVRPGASVFLEHWGGENPLSGRVRLVEPAAFTKISALGVEEQRVNVLVDFEAPPEARPSLGDAFRVEARIVTWEGADVLKVPAGALFRHGEEWAVFAAKNDRAHLAVIQAGHNNGLEAEVISGLEEGAEVILHPSDRIEDGSKIVQR